MPSTYRPLLNFMIIGAQKCGTTALAHFLAQHPRIRMSSKKEPHLFDAPDYSPDWTPEQIDDRYRPYFDDSTGTPTIDSTGTPTIDKNEKENEKGTPTFDEKGTPTIDESGTPTIEVTTAEAPEGIPALEGTPAAEERSGNGLIRGEATPIYLFLPGIVPELKRYNPALKVVVLMRDPVERAVSHYYMEKNKGYERLPLWLALVCEPWRLWRCGNARRHGSAWRRYAYRRRGLYSLQLRDLFRHFDSGQVALVRAEQLARHHDAVLKHLFDFLRVEQHADIEAQTVFEGERGGRRHPVISRLLRMSFLAEFIRMRRFKFAGVSE